MGYGQVSLVKSLLQRFTYQCVLLNLGIILIRAAKTAEDYFYVTSNRSLSLYAPIGTWTKTTEVNCAGLCSESDDCRSFTWDTSDGTCTIGLIAPLENGGLRPEDDQKKLYVKERPCPYHLAYELRSNGSSSWCLYLSHDKVVYTEAKTRCRSLGGRLCKANTVELIDTITQMFLERGQGGRAEITVGLDRLPSEDAYVWIDEQPLTPNEISQLFYANQPDKYNGEKCVDLAIGVYGAGLGRLNDHLCNENQLYVCEWDPWIKV